MLGAIADGINRGIAGAQEFIHHDSVIHFEPRLARQFHVGDHADTCHHQIGADHAAIAQHYRVAPNFRHLRVQQYFNALTSMHAEKVLGEQRRNRAGHQPGQRLDHRHRFAVLARGSRYLQADEAAADDCHSARLGDSLAKRNRFVERAQIQHMLRAGHR